MKRVLSTSLSVLACSLALLAQDPGPDLTKQPFLMAVEDVFNITGRGIVATGQVERGTVKVGDVIEIVGSKAPKTATVVALEKVRQQLTEAKAGDAIGILLRGVERADIERGQVLAKPGSIKTYTKAQIRFDMLTASEGGRRTPIATGYRPQVMVRTGSFSGTITLQAGKESVAPGDKDVDAEIELSLPAPLEKGQKIAFREGGRTVGTATVVELRQ